MQGNVVATIHPNYTQDLIEHFIFKIFFFYLSNYTQESKC